jgi:hypothetical protein
MSEQGNKLREMEEAHRAKVAEIRADTGLGWEAKERKIRELGERYYRALREAEQAA